VYDPRMMFMKQIQTPPITHTFFAAGGATYRTCLKSVRFSGLAPEMGNVKYRFAILRLFKAHEIAGKLPLGKDFRTCLKNSF
jgi:hypothetical protein